MPRLLSCASTSDEPAMNALYLIFHPCVGGERLERRIELEALRRLVEAGEPRPRTLRREHVSADRLMLERSARRGLHPHDHAACGSIALAMRLMFGTIARASGTSSGNPRPRSGFCCRQRPSGAAGLDGVVAQELALAANDALLDRVGIDVAMYGGRSRAEEYGKVRQPRYPVNAARAGGGPHLRGLPP